MPKILVAMVQPFRHSAFGSSPACRFILGPKVLFIYSPQEIRQWIASRPGLGDHRGILKYLHFQFVQKLTILPMALGGMPRPGISPVSQGFRTLLIVFTQRLKSLVACMQVMKQLFPIRKSFDDQEQAWMNDCHGVTFAFRDGSNDVGAAKTPDVSLTEPMHTGINLMFDCF